MINYNDLIGQPFDEQKNNCYDVLREVFRRNGVIIPKTNISVCACKDVSDQEIQAHKKANWVQIDKPEVPCGILILSTNPDFANHIAAYIGKGKMIHTTLNRAIVIDRISDWQQKIIGFYKYVDNNN